MARIVHDVNVQNWPKMSQVINEVAAQLQAHYGAAGIPGEVIKRQVEEISDYRKDSVIPSDYCYNLINKAPVSFKHPILVRVERGRFKYVGPGYRYIGSVMWKPKQGREIQVGIWHGGMCELEIDPRQPLKS